MARFRPNPNFKREVEREVEFRQALMIPARAAAALANALGHRIMPKGKGPTIKVEADLDGVRIVNHAYGSHIDEYGSANNPAYAPLRRGVRAAGLKFTEASK